MVIPTILFNVTVLINFTNASNNSNIISNIVLISRILVWRGQPHTNLRKEESGEP